MLRILLSTNHDISKLILEIAVAESDCHKSDLKELPNPGVNCHHGGSERYL